jgi:hypothetical protein
VKRLFLLTLIALLAAIIAPAAYAHGGTPHAGQEEEVAHGEEESSIGEVTPLMGNLGDLHHPITTNSELANVTLIKD